MTENPNLGIDALSDRTDAVLATARKNLIAAFPDQYILETSSWAFSPDRPGPSWQFRANTDPTLFSQIDYDWHSTNESIVLGPNVGWFEARWNSKTFQLLILRVTRGMHQYHRWYLVASSKADAEAFFAEVCSYHTKVHGEILVFQDGCWSANKALFEAIQKSTFDDLVLEPGLKETLVADIEHFLAQKSIFEEYRIAWKRGILLLGPPGNGKTHLIRALANRLGLPCLYVKSFEAEYSSAHSSVSKVFARAREMAPCLLVLEDLDTLLTDSIRSYFLNEMDGFASNEGIVTIATCNFPEKLDAAITDRPSRFDRKYHFNLPGLAERKSFLETFQQRYDARLQLGESDLLRLAEASEDYSFAYLKELSVSSVVRWFSSEQDRPLVDVMIEQAALLRSQMATDIERMSQSAVPDDEDEDDEAPQMPYRYRRR